MVHSSLIQWSEISLAATVPGSQGGLFRHLTLLKLQIMSHSYPQLHGPGETKNTELLNHLCGSWRFSSKSELICPWLWSGLYGFSSIASWVATQERFAGSLNSSTVVQAVFVRSCREHVHTAWSNISFHFGKGKKGSCSTLPETILVAAKLATRESQEPMAAVHISYFS